MAKANIPDKIQTWQMVTPFRKDRETGEVTPGKLEKTGEYTGQNSDLANGDPI